MEGRFDNKKHQVTVNDLLDDFKKSFREKGGKICASQNHKKGTDYLGS